MIKLDKLDKKILTQLMNNSRLPITQLAKQVNSSREVVDYRVKKLVKEKIILDFTTQIDVEKLGFIGAAIFINIKSSNQKEFEKYLKKTNYVSWVAQLSGMWNYGFSIYGKTNEEIDQKFSKLYMTFKDSIINHRFTLHKKSTFFYEKYFKKKSFLIKKTKMKDYEIDKKDKIILKELSLNSRRDTVDIANILKISAVAVAKRIKQLEESKIIQTYSIFVDISKLKIYQYSIFIKQELEKKKELTNYLKEHSNVSFIAKYIGDQFLEFGLHVKDPYELRKKLNEIEEKFPDNRIIEISLFQKEFVSVGAPSCIFE